MRRMFNDRIKIYNHGRITNIWFKTSEWTHIVIDKRSDKYLLHENGKLID